MSAQKNRTKFKVSIEDESFELKMQVFEEAKDRRYLTIAVLSIAVTIAMIATIYGFETGKFDGLIAVGLFIEAPLMSVLGYYYGRNYEKEN